MRRLWQMIHLTLISLWQSDSEDSNSVFAWLTWCWMGCLWCAGNPVCSAGEHPLPNGPGPPVAARELQGLLGQTDGGEGCGTFQQNPAGHWQKILWGDKVCGSNQPTKHFAFICLTLFQYISLWLFFFQYLFLQGIDESMFIHQPLVYCHFAQGVGEPRYHQVSHTYTHAQLLRF